MSQTTNASSTAAHAGTPVPLAASHNLPSPVQNTSTPAHSAIDTHSAAYRTEMEIVKAENDALRQRVRALERALLVRNRRDSSNSETARSSRALDAGSAVITSPVEPTIGRPAISPGGGVAAWAGNDGGVGGVAGPRERSESRSTTASSRRGGGLPGDDEVKLGESAGSVGIGRGA